MDGEIVELVPNVPITFTIPDPANGARFSSGQSIIAAGTTTIIAAVKLTLRTSIGTYKVKATCPDEVCTSGAKEVTFTATAKSDGVAENFRRRRNITKSRLNL